MEGEEGEALDGEGPLEGESGSPEGDGPPEGEEGGPPDGEALSSEQETAGEEAFEQALADGATPEEAMLLLLLLLQVLMALLQEAP